MEDHEHGIHREANEDTILEKHQVNLILESQDGETIRVFLASSAEVISQQKEEKLVEPEDGDKGLVEPEENSEVSMSEEEVLWRESLEKVKKTSEVVRATVLDITAESYESEGSKEQLIQVICCEVAFNLLYHQIPILTQKSLKGIIRLSRDIYHIGGSPPATPIHSPTSFISLDLQYFSRKLMTILNHCDKYSYHLKIEKPEAQANSLNVLINSICEAGYGQNRERKEQVCAIIKTVTEREGLPQYYVIYYDGKDNLCIVTTQEREKSLGMLNTRAIFFPSIASLETFLTFDDQASIVKMAFVNRKRDILSLDRSSHSLKLDSGDSEHLLDDSTGAIRREFFEELSILNLTVQKDIHTLHNQTVIVSNRIEEVKRDTERELHTLAGRIASSHELTLECKNERERFSEHTERYMRLLEERIETLEAKILQRDEQIEMLASELKSYEKRDAELRVKYEEKEETLIEKFSLMAEKMTLRLEEENKKMMESYENKEKEYSGKFLELLVKQKFIEIRDTTNMERRDHLIHFSNKYSLDKLFEAPLSTIENIKKEVHSRIEEKRQSLDSVLSAGNPTIYDALKSNKGIVDPADDLGLYQSSSLLVVDDPLTPRLKTSGVQRSTPFSTDYHKQYLSELRSPGMGNKVTAFSPSQTTSSEEYRVLSIPPSPLRKYAHQYCSKLYDDNFTPTKSSFWTNSDAEQQHESISRLARGSPRSPFSQENTRDSGSDLHSPAK